MAFSRMCVGSSDLADRMQWAAQYATPQEHTTLTFPVQLLYEQVQVFRWGLLAFLQWCWWGVMGI